MNTTDATDLAKRIINTWQGGPRLDEWQDVLIELDTGTAGTAYIRCRNELEHAPSIAKYMHTYRALNTASNQPIPQDECPLGRCSGDGWITTTFTRNGHEYRGAQPCGCPPGRLYEAGYNRTLDKHRQAS